MKITIDSKSFVEAIQWATKSYDTKNDRAYIALRVNNEGVGVLAHTNNASHLKSHFTILDIDLDGKNNVDLALDGRYLQRLAGALNDGPVILSDDTGSLVLKSKVGKFTIPTLKASIGSDPEVLTLGEIDEVEYFDYLQRLAKLCDPASASLLPALGVVDLKFDATSKTLTMMATDRYALGEITIDFTPGDDVETVLDKNEETSEVSKNLLLPYESAVLVSASKASENVQLIFEENSNKFGYAFTDGRVALFALKETDPLSYRALKAQAESNNSNHVTLNTKDLQKAIGIISNLDWENTDVYIEISEDKLAVSDATKTQRLEVETDEIETDDTYTVRFIRSVINEAFAPIATNKITLNFNSESSAFVFEPVLDTGEAADNVFVLAQPKV